MLETIKNSALIGNTFQAVQINFESDAVRYHVIVVQKKKEAIIILDSFTSSSFEALSSKLQKNNPILLAFTGQGIISKKVSNTPNYQSQLLFNANLEDFYWYELQYDTTIFASIARNTLITEEISMFTAKQFFVIDISVGPFVIAAIKSLLPETTTIAIEEHRLFFEDNQLVNLEKADSTSETISYTIGEDPIPHTHLLGFATIINHLYPNPEIVYDISATQETKETFGYKRLFNFFGIFMLGFFLLSLLASFLLLGYYQNNNQELQLELAKQNVAYNQLIALEKDKENKEAILKASGLDDSNFLTFYLTEVTRQVPNEMNLTLFKVFPTQKKIKNGQRIIFENNSIALEGVVKTNGAFTQWIQELKKLSWVRNLEIIDFRKDKNQHRFTIKITIQFDV